MIGFKATAEHNLYSESLAPVEHSKRTIKPLGLGILWFGMAVQVTSFVVLTPLMDYYTFGECAIIIALGQFITCIGCYLIQHIGLKYGISFATSINALAGPVGGKIFGLVRSLPALTFIGLNGFMGATAVNMFLDAAFGINNMVIALVINCMLLSLVTLTGAKGIERFTSFAAPLMIIVGTWMFIVLMKTHSASIADIWNAGAYSGTSKSWLYGLGVVIGGFAAVTMGWNDFTKDATIKNGDLKKAGLAHFISISLLSAPVYSYFSVLGCAAIVLVPGLTGGEVLSYLTNLICGGNRILIIVFALFIFVAQLSTNSAANIFPSAYVACSFFPKKLNFKVAAVAVTVIGFALRPWALGSLLDEFQAVLGAAGGPIIALIIVDYWYFRKGKLSLDDVFKSKGKYYYAAGINWAAIIACVIGTICGCVFLNYGFFMSILSAAIIYIIGAKIMSKKYPAMVTETSEDITDFN